MNLMMKMMRRRKISSMYIGPMTHVVGPIVRTILGAQEGEPRDKP